MTDRDSLSDEGVTSPEFRWPKDEKDIPHNDPPKPIAYLALPGVGLGPLPPYPAILTFANPFRNKLLIEIFEKADEIPDAGHSDAWKHMKEQFPDLSDEALIEQMIVNCAIYVQCIERLRSGVSPAAQLHRHVPYHNRHCYTTKGPCEIMLPSACGCACAGCSPEKEL